MQVGQSPEAAVNCANALCSWAELLPPLTNAGSSSSSSGDPSQQLQPQAPLPAWRSQQLELFERARQLYEQAVAQEEDALTWGNMGDCLMQYAQVGGLVTGSTCDAVTWLCTSPLGGV